MKWMSRLLMAVWLPFVLVSCAGGSASNQAIDSPAPATRVPGAFTVTSTPPPAKTQAPRAFPRCDGMQALKDAVDFDWPNLADHKQEFWRSQWTYFACEQPAEEVAALYRRQLTEPPYGMEETNWLERQEGTLGVYFSQAGSWAYVWFIPQPNDPQRSYVIIAESFTYVEC